MSAKRRSHDENEGFEHIPYSAFVPDCRVRHDHSAFYERSSIKNCDLFICVDNGKLYCPGEKEMFEWRGEVGKADFDGKTKAKPSRNKDYER